MSAKSAIFLSRESLNENGKERVGIDFRFLSLSVRPEEGGPDNDQCTRLAGVNSSACDRGHEGGDRMDDTPRECRAQERLERM